MTFGEWLRSARKFHNLTLENVAAKTGASKSHIWDLEHDKCNPTLETAAIFANAFGLPLWKVLKKMEGE